MKLVWAEYRRGDHSGALASDPENGLSFVKQGEGGEWIMSHAFLTESFEFGSLDEAKQEAERVLNEWVMIHTLGWRPSLVVAPMIVCLCGSTKFWREFQKQSLRLTMEGVIVLSIGAASGTDDDHFGNLPREEYDAVKQRLDDLHKRKIDLADEILVLNVGGYIGDSTRSEIEYATEHFKEVRWLEPQKCRKCGCTEDDCTTCVDRTGEPCHWVEPDLCSACQPINAGGAS